MSDVEGLDPTDLHAVPEEQRTEVDPGHVPEHTGDEPDDLSDAPEGDPDEIVYFDVDEEDQA